MVKSNNIIYQYRYSKVIKTGIWVSRLSHVTSVTFCHIDESNEPLDTTDPLIRVELSELIENLSDDDRKVFSLKASGYSIEEIANHMGISKTRVRQRLVRIKRKMEEYIDEI